MRRLFALVASLLFFASPVVAIAEGTGTIGQIDQWKATTSPYNAITTNISGKDIYAPFSSATTSDLSALNLVGGGCLQALASGLITATGVACGTGSGSGTSFGKTWEITPAGFLAPTTTITALLNNGFVSQASSTVTGDFTVTGLFSDTNTGTSSFSGGLSTAGLASSNGLTLTGGLLRATGTQAVIGTTTLAALTVVNSSTSTFNNGINLNGGCFAVNNVCVTGAVTSVSAGNSTLTISPTTGAVLATLNLGNTNVWTALQHFNGAGTTTFAGGIHSGSVIDGSGLVAQTLILGPGSGTTTQLQGASTGTSTLAGVLNVTGTNSTSTFSGGVNATYFNLTGATATSTSAGGIRTAGLQSTNGLTVTGGAISATTTGAVFGTTTVAALTVINSSTSTFNNGINLASGCFAIANSCIGTVTSVTAGNSSLTITPNTGAVSAVLNTANSNTWTVLQVFSQIGIGTSSPGTPLFAVAGQSNLSGTTTVGYLRSTTTIDSLGLATSTFAGGVQAVGLRSSNGFVLTGGSIQISSAATSTSNNGFNITGGCYAINNTCLSASGAASSPTQETPSGNITGNNAVFTVTNSPFAVYLNGAYQAPGGVDYTLSGTGPYTITFVTPPASGSNLFTLYGAASGGGGSGTVTSVDVSGGTTGLTFSGGAITTSGTITMAGILGIANGGTNATSFSARSLIGFDGTRLVATSSPTVGTITGTSTATSTFAGGLSAVGLASSQGFVISGGNIALTSGATSTGNNGFNISAGCFAINNSCISGGVGGGSGTVNSGTTGQIPYYASAGTSLNATSSIFIDSNQNIGIGTTTPLQKLHIFRGLSGISAAAFNGGFSTRTGLIIEGGNNQSPAIILASPDGATSALFFGGPTDPTAGSIQYTQNITESSGFMQIISGGSERARVQGDGKVGIASTSPWTTFGVNGTVAFNGLSSATGQNAVCINPTTKELVNAGGNTCNLSSQFFKHNIEDISLEQLSVINDLRPVTYFENGDNTQHYGFIAEEVEKIDPLLVEHAKADTVISGHAFKEGDPIGIDYVRGWALLTKFVQQQQLQINTLAAGGRSTAEENWQWIIIGLLSFGMIYQQRQIKELKKK